MAAGTEAEVSLAATGTTTTAEVAIVAATEMLVIVEARPKAGAAVVAAAAATAAAATGVRAGLVRPTFLAAKLLLSCVSSVALAFCS